MGQTQLKVQMNSKKKFTERQREEFYLLIDSMLFSVDAEETETTLTAEQSERLRKIFTDTKDNMDGIIIAFQAIRNCYSPLETKEILKAEFKKYFLSDSSDKVVGGENDAQRLIRFIFNSSHTSTLEHLSFTFHITGTSRALLAQLTRHRHWSFSVKSQRYIKLSSDSRSGGFDYIIPPTVKERGMQVEYEEFMDKAQDFYDKLIANKVPQEDARFVLPNSAEAGIVASFNLASALDFYKKRKRQSGAQWEIAELAERIREEIVFEEPWTAYFFDKL